MADIESELGIFATYTLLIQAVYPPVSEQLLSMDANRAALILVDHGACSYDLIHADETYCIYRLLFS